MWRLVVASIGVRSDGGRQIRDQCSRARLVEQPQEQCDRKRGGAERREEGGALELAAREVRADPEDLNAHNNADRRQSLRKVG